MGILFGTDGIRGFASQDPVTPETGLKLGRSLVRFCQKRDILPSVVIGRDTRISGEMLEHALVSGILSAGGSVRRAGVIPTPGVALLSRELKEGAGVVLSASHNPWEYNGFKLFSGEGFKLSEEEESEIESMILEDSVPLQGTAPGRADIIEDAQERYISFLAGTLNERLGEMKIVIDCANGATYRVAPALFERLGLDCEVLFAAPDGTNINRDCGSQHTETLSRRVADSGADLGLAFDGDGDRLIAVDETGKVLTGDQIITICAKMLLEKGRLTNGVVVSTVMSNMGLGAALKGFGVSHVSTRVGDRHVMEEMRKQGSVLGGEDSGHIIFLDHHTTGDGLLSALELLQAVVIFNKPLSVLSGLMTVFPQTLLNVPVNTKPDIADVPGLAQVIKDTEGDLGEDGRVLVRYSGTEPLCRVMVEGKRQEEIEAHARRIADVIAEKLNS